MVEGEKTMMVQATKNNIFQGITLPNNGPCLSHVVYADDGIFLGEWSISNIQNLKRILRVFYLASSLKINLSKSNLYCVCVHSTDVDSMSSTLSHSPGSLPFSYLGLPVGNNMNHIKN